MSQSLMTMLFNGLAVFEPESDMVRFTGFTPGQEGEPEPIVCHISHKTLAALCPNKQAPLSELMRAFERHRAVIEAAAADHFARGETSPIVTVRDILLKR